MNNEDRNNCQPNVVICSNGLPIGVIELKNPSDENAMIKGAFKQLTRDELCYTLRVDPKDVYGDDFPGETFRVLKEREIKQYGDLRSDTAVGVGEVG